MSIIVPPYGPTPNSVLLVGEAPGYNEAYHKPQPRPFVGRSGEEQRWYLSRHSISPDSFRQTNIVWEYIEGNPDPTPSLISKWRPHLISEIRSCRPKLIVAVGRFAARAFLGNDLEMEICHGIPHNPGAFEPSIYRRFQEAGLGDTVILPVYHPALGFYDNDARALIAWDYSQVAECIRKIKSRTHIYIRRDEYEGKEQYLDVTGVQLSYLLDDLSPDSAIALDTEGTPSDPWSIQVSLSPGTGYCLRRSQPDFIVGINALQRVANNGSLIIAHNLMYDLPMCQIMGLDLYAPTIRLWDTQYGSYLKRLEPQGLKPLLWRWCGMRQTSYQETVGDAGRMLQLVYLGKVASLTIDWPKPEPQQTEEHDGTTRTYKPQPIYNRICKILVDFADNKLDKDGNPVDILDRWLQVDKALRKPVEDALGPMPIGTLNDIELAKAIHYACRDSDGCGRLYPLQREYLSSHGLLPLMETGMAVLPIFSEMQSTGMPASRSHFQQLYDDMSAEMRVIQRRISTLYYSSKPFNPGSPQQVGALMRRRGLRSEKRTESGAMSTSKGSIEHLRYSDPAISDVFEWRERQHIRDSFCEPILSHMTDMPSVDILNRTGDIYPIHCQLKVTRTTTRRLSSTNPNLLAIPARTELGIKVRNCFLAPPGFVFGSWDLSAIEMRVMADESQDPLMFQLFTDPDERDIHYETASRVFGIPLRKSRDPKERYMDIDKMKHRYPAKTAGFGILYGIQGGGLATQLRKEGLTEWDDDSCAKLIKEWLGVYKGVADYIYRVYRETLSSLESRDRWGMPRYLPGIANRDYANVSVPWRKGLRLSPTVAEAVRCAVSQRIQGGARGMVINAYRYLRPIIYEMQRQGLAVQWALDYHDEMVLLFSEDLWDTMNDLVIYALTQECGTKLRIPVVAEGSCSISWGGLKG